jgi:hypothetical protein
MQVVMLGAGMDTRPWRLPLSPSVSWFEVDRADVLAAKQAALRDAGASFESNSGGSAASKTRTSQQNSSSSQQNSTSEQDGTFQRHDSHGSDSNKDSTSNSACQQGDSSSSGPSRASTSDSTVEYGGNCSRRHPLRVGRWGCASADLQKPGWNQKLQQAGLKNSQPTVSTN